MAGTTAIILTLIGAVLLCGVVVWFVLRRTKQDAYRGTVANKKVNEGTDGDGGTYDIHVLVVALEDGGQRQVTVSRKVWEQFAVGDRIVKQAGASLPGKG